MSKYQDVVNEVVAKVRATANEDGKHPVAASNSDLTMMTQALLNSPEHTVTEYNSKAVEEDGSPVKIEKKPAERYRESLKPMLRNMGIDKAEVDKLDEYQFSKEHGSALMGVASTVIKDYIGAGRKFKFPITGLEEAQMSISVVNTPERDNKTKRFEDVEGNGRPVPVDTGKITTTAAHKSIKASNAVPHYLKKEKK